jgi:flagellar biosynthesis chaperone FliJ
MADPFSILTGTAGLADVCIRLTKFLKQARSGFRAIDQELEDLLEEIVSLRSVNDLVERSYTEGSIAKNDPEYANVLRTHWRTTHNTLAGCQRIVEQLEELLKEVSESGSGKHIKLDQLRKWLKQQAREEAFNTLREKLKAHQTALQLSLSAISMSVIIVLTSKRSC